MGKRVVAVAKFVERLIKFKNRVTEARTPFATAHGPMPAFANEYSGYNADDAALSRSMMQCSLRFCALST